MNVGFESPYILWFLVALVPLTLFYLLRDVWTTRTVPATEIWEATIQKTGGRLGGARFQRFLEWFAAVLFLVPAVLVSAGIHISNTDGSNEYLFLLDNSSSMVRTGDGETSYLERATENVNDHLANLSTGNRWAVFRLAPRLRSIRSGRGPVASEALSSPPDPRPLQMNREHLASVFSALHSRLGDKQQDRLILYTDAQLPIPDEVTEHESGTDIVSVGGSGTNMAVVDGSVIRDWKQTPNQLEITARNFSSEPQSVLMRTYGKDDRAKQLSLDGNARTVVTVPIEPPKETPKPKGVRLETGDSFPVDDAAYFYVGPPARRSVEIQLHRSVVPFVKAAVRSFGDAFVPVSSRGAPEDESTGASNPQSEREIVLFDGETAASEETDVSGRIRFSSGNNGEQKRLQQPERIVLKHPDSFLDDIDFSELRIQDAAVLEPSDRETGVLSADGKWIGVQGTESDGTPYLRFGFSLDETNFYVLPEFPVFLRNVFSHFLKKRKDDHSWRVTVGERVRPETGDARLNRRWLGPSGTVRTETRTLSEDETEARINQPGWFQLRTGNQTRKRWVSNFFFPAESKMNRTVPDHAKTSISISSRMSVMTTGMVKSLLLLTALVSLVVFWIVASFP